MTKYPTNQVVLVDDDPDFGLLVREAFLACDPQCQLETLDHGPALWAWLETHPKPNIILLDINMPTASGFDVLASLKAQGPYKAIPVVMLTVSEQRADVEQSYQLGANAYLVKPPTFTELQTRMHLFTQYWFGVASTTKPESERYRP